MGIFKNWLQREIDDIEQSGASVDWSAVEVEEIYLAAVNGASIESGSGSSAAISLEVTDGDGGITLAVASGNAMRADSNGVGFNGATPSIPEIPATPEAQDIADVLVALGLATQATP